MIKLICKVCGKKFEVGNDRKNTAKYCSRYCYNGNSKIIKKCLICKTSFLVIKSREKTAKFCSRKCLGISKQGVIPEKAFKKGDIPWNKGKKYPQFSRENSSSWKGGRYKTDSGYTMCHCPKHPFKNNQGYVREHRLVMEKYIERYLKPSETVHHIDGIKNNNRIKNLILFKSRGYHSAFHRWEHCNPSVIIFDGSHS